MQLPRLKALAIMAAIIAPPASPIALAQDAPLSDAARAQRATELVREAKLRVREDDFKAALLLTLEAAAADPGNEDLAAYAPRLRKMLDLRADLDRPMPLTGEDTLARVRLNNAMVSFMENHPHLTFLFIAGGAYLGYKKLESLQLGFCKKYSGGECPTWGEQATREDQEDRRRRVLERQSVAGSEKTSTPQRPSVAAPCPGPLGKLLREDNGVYYQLKCPNGSDHWLWKSDGQSKWTDGRGGYRSMTSQFDTPERAAFVLCYCK